MKQIQLASEKKLNDEFVPKVENFETSLKYEGLGIKKENKNKSIRELQQKYAR